MKLYGSLDNRLAENTLQPIPEVGMGATEMLYSDRHAYTILKVSKETVRHTMQIKDKGEITVCYPKWIIASQDETKLKEGSRFSEMQDYIYSNDGDFSKAEKFFFNKTTSLYRRESRKWDFQKQKYVPTGRTNKEQQCLIIGYRDEYFDPCF
jgi:hypothetical protein